MLLKDLNTKWVQISTINPFVTEQRVNPQFAVLSDKKRFIINGGRRNMNGLLANTVNETIMYNSVGNTWQRLPSYLPWDNTQVAFATAVDFQAETGEAIGFFGGKDVKGLSCNAFTNFTIFNLSSQEWNYFSPQKNLLQNFYISEHTATLNPKSGKIYYLGGQRYSKISCSESTDNGFNTSYVFDTKKGVWDMEVLKGQIPDYRTDATATLGNDDMVALNVSDIKNIKQIDAYPYPLPVISNNSSSTTSNSTNPTDGSLTSGGKAGVAVGSVIGVATIAAVAFYVYRRRKRLNLQQEDTQSHQLVDEEVYVDWDKIESQYREIQLPAFQNSSSHASLELPRITPDEVTDVSPKFQQKSKLSQTPDVNY
ncbi:hypothetical protein G6F55_007348 [Rhizopus delemar]|uniref:Kelch repeat protein n=2 Tax=Rhizopus TaxID=4842 RepID=A0A9P6Z645_9FUNG|nr:hypothetical protein G6F55_007348 [Rhizopus delemar]KAG1540185.1 hypothetical protein G6F51_008677 [Rhizopus arrhizus]KAG1499923.1 hypothetical protein G6F54_004071 [Rhizopus delemar]KAG1508467.1 hypothetical protein G6F53_008172 [Rhizopus delemar]KAG1521504.1 hypothetical protein G6F52_006687 [Rhizopus delemar]